MKSKFKVFNQEYDIILNESPKRLENDSFEYGICSSQENYIELTKNTVKGKPLSKQNLETNTLHEILHAIFEEGYYDRYSADEQFVEWCAKCLYDIIINQDIFELKKNNNDE